MVYRSSTARQRRDQGGFTLIELLVVIIILGVLSSVVVFAVGGIGDKGQTAAKATDVQTVRTAQEAYCARNGRYATEQELVDGGFLSEQSSITDTTPTVGGACNGAGDTSKSGFVTGFGQPNGVSPEAAAAGYPELKLAISGTGNGIYPTPFETGGRGPATLQTAYIFDALLWKDSTGQPIPWIAEKVPNRADGSLSADGKTWKFKLRDNVFFTDGVKLTVEDVKFTFDYQRPARGVFPGGAASTVSPCFCLSAMADVDTVTADPLTREVTFNLNKPSNTFVSSLIYSMVILPKHIWENVTTGSTPFNIMNMHAEPTGKGYIGSGPYKFFGNDVALQQAYNPGTGFGTSFYTANTSYMLGTPYVRKLSFVAAGSDSVLALKNGIVDAGGIGTEEFVSDATISQLSSFSKASTPGGFNRTLQFNLLKPFPFNNVKFRQAVAYAVDRQFILQNVLGGRGVTPSFGTLNPTHPFVAPNLPGYDLGTRAANIAKAKALLTELGFTDNVPAGGDGTLELPATSVNWNPTLYTGATTAATATVPGIVELNLADVGLDFTQQADTTQPVADTRSRNGNYEMMMVNWGNNTSDPDQLRGRFSSTVCIPGPTASFACSFGWAEATGTPGAAAEFETLAVQQLVEQVPALRKQQIQRMQGLVAGDVLQFALYIPDQLIFYPPNKFTAWYGTPGGTPAGPPSYSNKHVFVTGKQFGLPAGIS